MRKWIICAAALAILAQAQPVQAGRRVRRAVRTTAIVAAATSTTAVVAAAPRRTTVVAAAAPRTTVVAAAVVPRAVVAVAALPDLTVTEVVAAGDALCVVITNIGTASSPQTRVQIDLLRPLDGAFLAGQTARVPALLVNQSVRLRLRSAPVVGVKAAALVDPRREVAELNETNNELAVAFDDAAPEDVPPVLDVEEGWGAPFAE
jgi:subtilase family serine protease